MMVQDCQMWQGLQQQQQLGSVAQELAAETSSGHQHNSSNRNLLMVCEECAVLCFAAWK